MKNKYLFKGVLALGFSLVWAGLAVYNLVSGSKPMAITEFILMLGFWGIAFNEYNKHKRDLENKIEKKPWSC